MLRETFNSFLRLSLLRALFTPQKCDFKNEAHRNLHCAAILRDLGGMAGEW